MENEPREVFKIEGWPLTEQEEEVIRDAKWRIAFALGVPTDKIVIVLPNLHDYR